MGNAISYHENLRRTAAERMSRALRSFIEKECPIYLTALRTDDHKLKAIVIKQFNESCPNYIFDNIYSILPHLERLRLRRVNQLNELTSAKFNQLPKIKLSCLPCKINDYLTLAYFDSGCSISCITLSNARKLNLISLIDYNISGTAVGFGCNRQIIGFITSLPVRISGELLFNINFVVINQANADFILIGQDFNSKVGLKMDYLNGKLIFPQQIIDEQKLDFIPSEREERDLFFDTFKYEMLEQNRTLMNNYFSNHGVCRSTDDDQVLKSDHKSTNTNLYMRIQINGKQVCALIDTGADNSKISDNLALQLDILRFIDYDKRKIALGLGSVISIGQIPPIPIRFESFDAVSDKKQSTTLFVSFEVLKESRVNVLLLGSDFFTYYGCYLDFKSKSIDIQLDPPCKYSLEEREPRNLNLMNDRSLLLNHNYLESRDLDEVIDAYRLSPELDELRTKIRKREQEYQIKKKLKKYNLQLSDRRQVSGKRTTGLNRDLLSTALNAFNRRTVKQIVHNMNGLLNETEFDELNEQTSSFLTDETSLIYESINDIQEFKSQSSNEIYCNGLPPEFEIKDSIVKINFVNKHT